MDYDYEKHVNKLVLGFLKDHCTSAYKAFLKHNFHQNQGKHIITRVAGLNLIDILRIYAQISEIVQGRIEETNYPVEHGSEKLSPIFLKEQLLYLLEHNSAKPFTRSRRTSTESSLTELTESHIVDNDDRVRHGSDVETTPENSLPGNVNYYCSTTKKMAGDKYSSTKKIGNDRSSMGMSRRKSTRAEKVVVNKEAFPGVMSEKLLQNREFQLKLANTITTVLNSPDMHSKKYGNNDTNDLDTTIKNALQKTENDPMFEEVLQEFLDAPVINPFAKRNTVSTTSSEHHMMDPLSPSKHSTSNTDRSGSSEHHDARRINSNFDQTLSVNVNNINNSTECAKSLTNSQSSHISNVGTMEEPHNSLDTHLAFNTPHFNNVTSQERHDSVSTSSHSVLNTPTNVISQLQTSQCQMATLSGNQQAIYLNSTPGGLIMLPQPYYVINQPISMTSNCRPVVLSANDASTATVTEVSSFDNVPAPVTSNTNKNEANNIQEYLTMYDDTKPSPLVKQQQKPQHGLKKVHYPKRGAIQPRPTVKVEILQVTTVKPPNKITEIKENTQKSTNESKITTSRSSSSSRSDKNMPSVGEKSGESGSKTKTETVNNTRNEGSNSESESKKTSSQKDAKSGPKLVTPSPSVVAVQKTTPRSGSHVRNLTFPSPSRMSRSSDAKLCIDKEDNQTEQNLSGMSLPICWDAGLRMFVDPPEEKKEKSPKKTRKTPKKVSEDTDLNATEIEGRKLEEALVTPKDKKKTSKLKTLSCKKGAKIKEAEKSDSLKKILSPSKLNASKRNIMDQANEAETNILLEETPLKCFPITPGTKTSETPFTPMLQANLKSITGGENIYSIDTPNFPVTPGLSLMTSYSGNYYIFQDDDKTVTNEIRKTEDVKGKQITTVGENDKAAETVEKTEEAIKNDNTDNKKRKLSEETLENEKKKPKLSPKKRRNTNTAAKKVKDTPSESKASSKTTKTPAKSKKKPIKTPNTARTRVETRETRSSVLSKLKNNPRNSPRNDSDDQCNFFKASGTNLKKLKKEKQDAKLHEEKTKMNHTLVVNIPPDVKLGQARLNVDVMSDKETELHMALISARQDYEICHFNEESQIFAQHDPTFKKSSPYDAAILNKKRRIHIFTAQDDEVPVLLSASKFGDLFEMDSIVKSVDKEPKENSSGEPLAVKNAKRRSRSDSNSSHHSTSSKKKEPEFLADASLLKNVNINSFLSQVHNEAT